MAANAHIEQARRLYEQRDWVASLRAFRAADASGELRAEDLELLATVAYLLGEDEDSQSAFERAYRRHVDAGLPARAARSAFWLGLMSLLRREAGAASAWLSRAEVQVAELDCVERGYLLVPPAEMQLVRGNAAEAQEMAARALAIGERFGDADLVAIAQHLLGRSWIQRWQVHQGLPLLDQAMLAATAGELSPIVTGLIYCSVIEACQLSFALDRAREWTTSLARWCDGQPDLVAFTSNCRAYRAEVLQLSGAWPDAMEEVRRAGRSGKTPARALYQQAELHRLRGEFDQAEAGYRRASDAGHEPQPGLCLLRLAQGRKRSAGAMIQRALQATTDRAQRARLLPAYVEVMVAVDRLGEAKAGCKELSAVAGELGSDAMRAMVAHAQGSVELEDGNAALAIESLRAASRIWEQIDVPYEAARSRVLVGFACRALGDVEGGQLEFDAARKVFERLGAVTELQRLQMPMRAGSGNAQALSERELQVLRRVAKGQRNKAIAEELHISPKTVDRHLSNIFAKLEVSTRTAAASVARERDLL